jgi:hypothetical protein
MPWEALYILNTVHMLFICLAQWLSVTSPDECRISDDGAKECGSLSGGVSIVFLVLLAIVPVYIWAYLSHSRDFLTAIAVRSLASALGIILIIFYASMSDVGAPIMQGIALLFDAMSLYITITGRKAMISWRESRKGMLPITHSNVSSAVDDEENIVVNIARQTRQPKPPLPTSIRGKGKRVDRHYLSRDSNNARRPSRPRGITRPSSSRYLSRGSSRYHRGR